MPYRSISVLLTALLAVAGVVGIVAGSGSDQFAGAVVLAAAALRLSRPALVRRLNPSAG